MTYITKLFLVLTLLVVSEKCSDKNKEASETPEDVLTKEAMIEDGFEMATLQANDTESCPMLLIMGEESLDPINIQDYKVGDGDDVWVKISRLRMKNRCDEANPIQILELKKD